MVRVPGWAGESKKYHSLNVSQFMKKNKAPSGERGGFFIVLAKRGRTLIVLDAAF
jgi:hypothetical protein